MSRNSNRSRIARALLAGTFALALGSSMGAAAQAPASEAATGATSVAAPADQPTSRRERRRNEEAAAEQTAAAEAVAAQPVAVATVAAQPAETVEAKMICRNIKVIGTKISRRICGTPEQWAAMSERTSNDASETMRQVRQQSGVMTTQSGTPGPGGFGAN